MTGQKCFFDIQKAQRKWACFSRILVWEGADPRTYGTFYKTVFQENLLFVLETLVITPRIRGTLGGFHHRVTRRIAGMQLKQYIAGRCEYLPLYAAMSEVFLEGLETYVLHHQNTIA